MPKEKTKFVCGECGHETGKWFGRCPSCGSWNTLVETAVTEAPKRSAMSSGSGAVRLSTVDGREAARTKTGIGELDRVLGGGIVEGSLILLSGAPGIGKSTILLQMCQTLNNKKMIYVSGEESARQIKLRSNR